MSDDLEDIMREPPGGWNHGRSRSDEGVETGTGWGPLDGYWETAVNRWIPYEEGEHVSGKQYVERWSPNRPFVHGTADGYTNRRCRCDECRSWKREYQAAHRKVV